MIIISSVICDCGIPGRSKNSQIINAFKHHYNEDDVVNYKCLYADAALLIGPRNRTCKNGHWTGSIPKCGI